VPREEIWITTKLDNDWHKKVEEGLDTSLKNLGVDYVDLYLMASLRCLSNNLTLHSTGLALLTQRILARFILIGIMSRHGKILDGVSRSRVYGVSHTKERHESIECTVLQVLNFAN
jgi:diketogulonate reductase-like aldo/keto reductase